MKNMILVSIFDTVVGEYSAPTLANNAGSAIRWYVNILNKGEYDPADFQLFKIGDFDVTTGIITPCHEFLKRVVVGENVEGDVLDE